MVRLDEMNTLEFKKYLSYAISNYATEHVKAGNWDPQEAISQATKEFEQLLPDGEQTANHKLFIIRNEEEEVGMIWLSQRSEEKGFIYDINIWDDFQGHGFGKQAMKEIESIAKDLGLDRIGLHVFAHNTIARSLYDQLGYKEIDLIMEKKI